MRLIRFATEVESGAGNSQGYAHYMSVAEWYHLRTPFTQWYTKNYTSVFKPLAEQMEVATGHAHASEVALLAARCLKSDFCYSQVLRRPTYKGAVATETALPVDATTALGTVLVLGSVLATNNLSRDAVDACHAVMRELSRCANLNCCLNLLPFDPAFAINLESGAAKEQDIKNMFRELQLPWCKPRAHLLQLPSAVSSALL